MKILAVIPTRADSKGIPNKNIRIIAGHPLVYYAIHNAIESKYITDIVVATNSSEIETISKQMGVGIHWLRDELCEDNVTLDPVVYDSVPKECNWDYVVTMQATSPTLTVASLDNAVEYVINNDIDTLVSGINDPHLSWGKRNGVIVPNYEKRLNRQFLPPEYRETGAFVISKGNVVKADSRFGEKIEIFELPKEEAYDIDTFEDLRSAETQLESRKTAIYISENGGYGDNYFLRALELVDELQDRPDIYYDTKYNVQNIIGTLTYDFTPVDSESDLLNYCEKKNYGLFINEGLTTSIEYMRKLRERMPDAKIVNIDDVGEGSIKADAVINSMQDEKTLPNQYYGSDCFIIDRRFLMYEPITIDENIKCVFVYIEDDDNNSITERFVSTVNNYLYKKYEFHIVCNKEIKGEISNFLKCDNICTYYSENINLPEIMCGCDVAVTTSKRNAYELTFLGIPHVFIPECNMSRKLEYSQNMNDRVNMSYNLLEQKLNELLCTSNNCRVHMQEELLNVNLKNGRKRVRNIIYM